MIMMGKNAKYGGAGIYVMIIIVTAAVAAGVAMLLMNITTRKEEAKQYVFKLAEITEDTVDPAEWGKNFPRQYDGYKRTVDIERTRFGGSEAFQKLDDDPNWRTLFKGYAFSVDYREERGHAYMLSDQDSTERVHQFKQPGSCLHCHSAIVQVYRQKGKEAGVPDSDPEGQLMKGFETVCATPYKDARQLVTHPVTCGDCHDPQTLQLRVTRPGFINGIRALAASDDAVPHLPSIERWRREDKAKGVVYEPNTMASRQEMRSYVCGQCHVEYYFKGDGKLVTYPWQKGLKVDQIEAYYDEVAWKDWKHPLTDALTLKAQHPEFELWSQGIHARSGVACADCHMPYLREGAIKISDHHVRSPLLNVARACQPCHSFPEEEMRARVVTIQERTSKLLLRSEEAVLALITELEKAKNAGIPADKLKPAQDLHRKAEWRLDYVAAENSMGFHAPQEAARILGEAIDYARQGQAEAIRLQAGMTQAKN